MGRKKIKKRAKYYNAVKEPTTENVRETTTLLSPAKERDYKKWRWVGVAGFILAFTLFMLRREIGKFNISILSASAISFQVERETKDSLKSPLCNCPDPDLNNYGFLNFFKQATIKNADDTSTYVFTAPSSGNLTTYGTYLFEADFYVFKNDFATMLESESRNGFAVDTTGNPFFIHKVHTDSLGFFSFISSGKIINRFLSENCISAFLPGDKAQVAISGSREKYSKDIETVTYNYTASYPYGKQPEDDNVCFEMFGPRVAVFADNVTDILGEKGSIYSRILDSFKSFTVIAVVKVPFKLRVTSAGWDQARSKYWMSEMFTNRFKDDLVSYGFVGNIPSFVQTKSAGWTFFNIDKDTAEFLPPIYSQRLRKISIALQEPLNDKEYGQLTERCGDNKIFKSPDYPEGVIVKKFTAVDITPRNPAAINELMRKQPSNFEDARQRAVLLKKMADFGRESGEHRNELMNIQFYYPQLPGANGIYYYGNLNKLKLSTADMNYSYGALGNGSYNDADVEMDDFKINETEPYYTRLPITPAPSPGDAFSLTGFGEIKINGSRVSAYVAQNPFIQSLISIMSILGVSLGSILAFIYPEFWKIKKSKSKATP